MLYRSTGRRPRPLPLLARLFHTVPAWLWRRTPLLVAQALEALGQVVLLAHGGGGRARGHGRLLQVFLQACVARQLLRSAGERSAPACVCTYTTCVPFWTATCSMSD
jgi:hypothetical protein